MGLGLNTSPVFVWEDKTSGNGVPLLRVRFPDGAADDLAVLAAYNPIPQGLMEREEEMDACIFQGYLLGEPDSSVTVTGCPFTDNFQVSSLVITTSCGQLPASTIVVLSLRC